MSAEIERAVLGGLIFAPGLLETCDPRDTDFPEGMARTTFRAISEIWEEGRPAEIDPIILAERIGGDDAAGFVASLMDGNIKLAEPVFRGRVAELRKRALTLKILTKINRQGTVLPLDLGDLRADLAEYDKTESRAFDPMTIMRTGAELQALDVHIDWTVDKLIPEGSLCLLYGPGGGGKTWLSLAIAKAVSEGVPFLGLATKQRPVVYIDYENPRSVVIDRTRKLDVRDVRFWTLADDPCPPKLDEPGWTQYRDLPLGSLLFFDTARASQSGDENSSQDVGLVMGRLKEIRSRGHEVVLLHHTIKVNDRGFKGSTAWTDLSDHTIAFHAVEPETLEEIDADPDPGALLALGTGKKTRFDHFKLYLTRDPGGPGYIRADSPVVSALNALTEHIGGEGAGRNQSELIKWAKGEGVGPSNHNALVALLKRGEREGRWKSHSGFRGAKVYEPST